MTICITKAYLLCPPSGFISQSQCSGKSWERLLAEKGNFLHFKQRSEIIQENQIIIQWDIPSFSRDCSQSVSSISFVSFLDPWIPDKIWCKRKKLHHSMPTMWYCHVRGLLNCSVNMYSPTKEWKTRTELSNIWLEC